jgi:hypothetical protein
MERARMHAEDRRDFQEKERQLKEQEADYDAALDSVQALRESLQVQLSYNREVSEIVQHARESLQVQLSHNHELSETSRRQLHAVNNLLSVVRVSDWVIETILAQTRENKALVPKTMHS